MEGTATVSHYTETAGPVLYVNTADKIPLIESFKCCVAWLVGPLGMSKYTGTNALTHGCTDLKIKST